MSLLSSGSLHATTEPTIRVINSPNSRTKSRVPKKGLAASKSKSFTSTTASKEIIFTPNGMVVREITAPAQVALEVERLVEAKREQMQRKQEGEITINGNVYEANYHTPYLPNSSSLASHLVSPIRRLKHKSASAATASTSSYNATSDSAGEEDAGESYFGVDRSEHHRPSRSVESMFGIGQQTIQLPHGRQAKLVSLQNTQLTSHIQPAGPAGQEEINFEQEIHTQVTGNTLQVKEQMVDRVKHRRRESVLRAIGDRAKSVIVTSHSDGSQQTAVNLQHVDPTSSHQFDQEFVATQQHHLTHLPLIGSPKSMHMSTNVKHSIRSPTQQTASTTYHHSQQRSYDFDSFGRVSGSTPMKVSPSTSPPSASPIRTAAATSSSTSTRFGTTQSAQRFRSHSTNSATPASYSRPTPSTNTG